KLSGASAQTNGLLASGGLLLTLSILRLKSVPDPFSGVKSSEKADMRRVLSVPGPVLRTFEETFQLVAVSPAASTSGVAKLTTAASKVKSAWNPTNLFFASIAEVSTATMNLVSDGSTATSGRATDAIAGISLPVVLSSASIDDGPSGSSENGEATSPKTSVS